MKVLVVYPDGAGEMLDVSDPVDVINYPYVDERPFVDKKIALCRMYDPAADAPVNQGVTLRRIYGTVVFARARNPFDYTNIDDKTVEAILRRFSNIKMKEETKCTKTSVSWWERLIKSLKNLLTGKK
jgi:hypothetical protein